MTAEAIAPPIVDERRQCACGTDLAPALLSCPGCLRLVHAERLAQLSSQARSAAAAADDDRELTLWRDVIALLPHGTAQRGVISTRIDELTRARDAAAHKELVKGPTAGTKVAKFLAPLGVAGLFVWKFKIVIVALLSKAKFLALGLTKSTTLFTMLASFGLYWTVWGWKFAAGLVASIYVHEMGHVFSLRRHGIRATAPMFIPGLGALVRLNEHPATAAEDARIGLAGPWWGFGAAVAALLAHQLTGADIWRAIAHTGAWINLFNLLPVWQLDGGRGVAPLDRLQRAILAALLLAAWIITKDGLLILLVLAMIYRTVQKEAKQAGNWRVFASFAMLIVLLAAMLLARVAL